MSLSVAVRLVVADVDGTLLDDHKQLTNAACEAVAALHEAGILFTIISARPPQGVRWIAERLRLTAPVACFNGGTIHDANMVPCKQVMLSSADAHRAAEAVREHGLDLWVFAMHRWYVERLNGYRVAEHAADTDMTPELLANDDPLHIAVKIVGVSKDPAKIFACEKELHRCCSRHISASRSQPYYLDITHEDANKGKAVREIAALAGIPLAQVATIGDMPTDVLMFRVSGMSIAMGNAVPDVQAEAKHVTTSNANEGFALAIRELLAGKL